jgi:hypothetical protein
MAIKVGGTSIISDDKNISNVGIVTIGTGGTTGQFNVGTGVTIDGAGNAYFDGFITVNGGINYLVEITSIQPQGTYLADNAIYDNWDGNLILYFDSNVEVAAGSTLTVELRRDQNAGPLIATAGISSINYPGDDFSVLEVAFGGISTTFNSGIATYFPIIPKGIIQFSVNGDDYAGNYSGDPQQNEFNFEFSGTPVGEPYAGGYLICASGGTAWVVAPQSAEVSRSWYSRADANSRAQSVTGCTGWFVPSIAQLQNPGYTCASAWDTYCPTLYWTNQNVDTERAYAVSMVDGTVPSIFSTNNGVVLCVRSFRCVSY